MTEHSFTRVERVARTGSTNTDLRQAVQEDPPSWPHLSVLVAEHQDAGRGRLGRSWETPAGTALTASVLVRPGVVGDRLSWITLVAGLAVQRGIQHLTGERTGLKWPNDVLALDVGEEIDDWGRDRKVAGILAEVAPLYGEPAVILGIGVNVAQSADQLPVPWATSMALTRPRGEAGGAAAPHLDTEDVLTAIGDELVPLLRRWEDDDPTLREEIAAVCVSLGREVVVQRPGGAPLAGVAEGLGPDGSLLVRCASGELAQALAGDVLHARRAGSGPL